MTDKNTNDDVSDEATEAEQHVEYVEHEDEHHSSLAAKTLSGALLLLIGGVLALWLGPKIAPALPSGMAPVAVWLAPGAAKSNVAISALSADVEARFAALPTPVLSTEVESMIATSTDKIDDILSLRIDTLSDQLRATDSAAIESRLARLELQSDGLHAELSSLTTQLGDVSAAGGTVSAQTSAQIATYAAALEGLKAELATLAAQNGALSQKIDGVSASAERQVAAAETRVSNVEQTAEAARTTSEIQTEITAIGTALEAGTPFGTHLTLLKNAGVEISPNLENASSGAATMPMLRTTFPDAAHTVIRASIEQSSSDGVFSSAGSFLRAQVASRSLTPQQGSSADAILSRAEEALRQNDLPSALNEISALPEGLHPPMSTWLSLATTRADALTAYRALQAQQPE